ncbi:MAG: hypothetical protein AVDCRST_MAG66-515, partial [uncultured Pseudonocardia sp.]
ADDRRPRLAGLGGRRGGAARRRGHRHRVRRLRRRRGARRARLRGLPLAARGGPPRFADRAAGSAL